MKIPLMTSGHGIVDLEITANELPNDPKTVTMVVPKELEGKVILPRDMFSKKVRDLLERKP
jgi:hypothetical protein